MSTRMATCVYGCGNTVPSSPSLAFFEDRSHPTERTSCGICCFVKSVHQETNPHTGRPGVTDHAYTPRLFTTDAYYCGCRGWD